MASQGTSSPFRKLWGRVQSRRPLRTDPEPPMEPVREPEEVSPKPQERLDSRVPPILDSGFLTEREQASQKLILNWHQNPTALQMAVRTKVNYQFADSSHPDGDNSGFIAGECTRCLFPFWGCRDLPSGFEGTSKMLDERWILYGFRGKSDCPGCNLVEVCVAFIARACGLSITETVDQASAFTVVLEWKSSPINLYFEPRGQARWVSGSDRTHYERERSNPKYLDLFIDQAHPPFGHISQARTISASTASTRSFEKAQEWLTQCSKSHELCRQQVHTRPSSACSELPTSSSSKFVPQRLIQLGEKGADELRLVEMSHKAPVPYVCLSHCWGRHALRCLTTKDTIDSHKDKIDVRSLPKTFRDAAEITFRLGFRYLWIDSMCIIQFDDEDWREQSSAMADIFQNSDLTLAAAWASDDEGGLYSRASSTHIGERYEWTAQDEIYLRMHIWHPYEAVIGPQVPMPLLTRAWVWQERLLSRRLLFFGANELLWECLEETTCECESWAPEQTSVLIKSDFAKLRTNTCSMAMINDYWRIVVQNYSALDLTFPRDRLPALSGVAKVFRDASGDDYLAGLWRSNLASDLGWRLASFPRQRRLHSSAPTWSWASVSGAVYWLNWGTDEFQVLDATTEPIGSDVTGEIGEGIISIEGLIFPIQLWLKESVEQTSGDLNVEELEIFQMLTQDSKADCDSATIHPDYVFWDSAIDFLSILAQSCHCFILGMGTMYSSVPALLLQRIDSTSEYDLPRYQRLGVVHINVAPQDKAKWCPQESDRQVFQIV